MINSYDAIARAGFALPTCWPDAVHAAPVRILPVMGGVSVAAAAAERRIADVAQVRLLKGATDGVVLAGAFPGTSAWSPPI